MANDPGTLEAIAGALAKIIGPVEERLESGQALELFAELGLDLPPALEANGAFGTALEKTARSVREMFPLLVTLIQKVEDEDFAAALQTGISLGGEVKTFVSGSVDVANAIKATPHPGISNADLDALPRKLLDYLVIRRFEQMPGAADVLELVGLFERTPQMVGTEKVLLRHIALDRIGDILTHPKTLFESRFGWGTPAFDGAALLTLLQRLFSDNGIPAIVDTSVAPPVLDVVFAEIQADTSINPPGLSISLNDPIGLANPPSYDGGDWKVELQLKANPAARFAFQLRPDGSVSFTPPSGSIEGDNTIIFTGARADGTPYTIVGEGSGSRISAQKIVAHIGAGLRADGGHGTGAVDIGADISGGKIVIDFSEGDGFINTILSGINMRSDFDLGMGYSGDEGLYFHGSSTLLIQLPLRLDLGVVELSALTLGLGIEGQSFPLSFALDVKGNLGPLQLVVEQIGAKILFSIAPSGNGALGPLDVSFAFKPPIGVGASIDAGVVKGGGYLRIDEARGEYAGVLQLSILDMVQVTAIGVITTKMPDGSKGFSFIAIISVEFNPGIQLGFGFTLIGVGGLVGLNRSMDLEAIAQGVRSGSVDTILFPQEVIANAPRIISDLRAFFPPHNGTFLIGPMIKFGWGTPTLISLSIGVIIEIPGNIAIVGKLTVAVPDADLPLIIINVAFIGAIEFDKKRGWFFAAIYDLRVVFMTLDGDMGVLAAFGDDANFVVSVGGFHPAYNPPPLPFPAILRIAINILNTAVARIRVDAYFAVTSNTVQFGASAELYFGISIASIEGHLGFDALFQFSPFYFNITISASLSVKLFGVGFFSVSFRGTLEGTSPWHVEGTGSISLLFFDVDVDFSHTWGDKEETRLPPISVMPILKGEYEKDANWTAKLSNASGLLVSLRPIDASVELVLHPLGLLQITQRAVPLGITLDRIGSQRPDDANRFTIDVTASGVEKRGTVRESFATAQFKDLSDADKLNVPDYEKQDAGLEFSTTGSQTNTDFVTKRVARYEQIVIDNNYKRALFRFTVLLAGLFSHFLGNNAAARSPISQKSKDLNHLLDDKIAVKQTGFVVVSTLDNGPIAGVRTSFDSHLEAAEFMAEQVKANPRFADEAHIVRPHEMRMAA